MGKHLGMKCSIKAMALASLSLFAGCIMMPRKVEPGPSDKRLDTEDLASFDQVDLPKVQVVEELGLPLTKTDDERIYLYLYFWRDTSTETHLINPLAIPIILGGGMYGGPVDESAWGALPTHQSEVKHTEKKIMLLIEFDERDYVKRTGVYKFPRHIIPIQIAEEWLLDPLPDYFEPVTVDSLKLL